MENSEAWHRAATLRARAERAEAERDRYHDALIARHGGEPIALLSELDEARAERDALRALLRECHDRFVDAYGPDGRFTRKVGAALDASLGTAETNLNDVKNVVSSFLTRQGNFLA